MKEKGGELRICFEFECKGEKELRESIFKFKLSGGKFLLTKKEKERGRKLVGNWTQTWREQKVKKYDGQKCFGK